MSCACICVRVYVCHNCLDCSSAELTFRHCKLRVFTLQNVTSAGGAKKCEAQTLIPAEGNPFTIALYSCPIELGRLSLLVQFSNKTDTSLEQF